MNEVIYLDEQGNACSENDELYTVIDDITARLMIGCFYPTAILL